MKSLSATLVMIILLLFCLGGCSVEQIGVENYQYMYDGILDDWGRITDSEKDNLFGYGEYLYNSFLLLFPRETPSTLTDYYFNWLAAIDVDYFAIYFTCQLTESNFDGFVNGLEKFAIACEDGNEVKPIFDQEHFSLPTYLLQWTEVTEKWEVLEYIMLDEENNTVVFVYTMGYLDYIEEYSENYNVTPTELHFLDCNFSIYGSCEDNYDYTSNEHFENCTYDISFLDYLK